jgi:hypothetical protein
LDALRKFEEITINNPIIKFAEEQGYFKLKNKDSLLWDSYFGDKDKTKSTTKSPASTTSKKKATTKVVTKTKTKAKTTAKTTAKKQPRLISTGSLADKLKQIASSQPDSSLDGDARQKAWVKHVDGLYKQLKTWLSDSAKNGHISFNVQKVTLSEDSLGSYEMDSLELDLVGAHQIIFQPVEMNILGAVGRIDVYHRGYNPHKVMLLLHDEGNNKFHWELWKGLKKEAQQPFNKKTLEALLSQWIES